VLGLINGFSSASKVARVFAEATRLVFFFVERFLVDAFARLDVGVALRDFVDLDFLRARDFVRVLIAMA
jgi:hypothetical protein